MGEMDPNLGVNPVTPTTIGRDDMDQLMRQRDLYRNMQISSGMDGDADQAAHSQELSEASGLPAPLVNSNYDEFVAQQKVQTAQSIAAKNPDIDAYIMSNPLAATVSNDDWANLDKFTRESRQAGGLSWLVNATKSPIQDIVEAGLSGAAEGLTQGVPVDDATRRALNPQQNQFGTAGALAATALFGVTDIAQRLMAGVSGGMEGAGIAAGGKLGIDEPESRRIVEGWMGGAMSEAGLHMHAPEPGAVAAPKPQTALDVAKPYFDAGELPPTGLHPEIDKIKTDGNAQYVDAMAADLDNMAKTETRERSPEILAAMTQRMYADSTFEINADAALKLYPDETKVPAADDGILGWVPDIQTQLEAARTTGTSVQIPIGDWMTKVDPALAKELHDDMVVMPGGISANEAKTLPTEAKAIITESLPTVRAASGLEPRFSIGDRKITLVPGAVEAGDQFHPEVHNFDLHDENGQPVGNLEIIPGPDKKSLYVNWIGGQAGLWANSFGPALVRDVKRQLKGLYPDYEYLTGHRVSGAREGVNNFGPMPVPKVRLAGQGMDHVADYHDSLEVLQHGWQDVGDSGVQVNRQPSEFHTHEELARNQATIDEVRRLAGPGPNVEGVTDIRDTMNPGQIHGLYVPKTDAPPDILTNMLGPDQLGTGRHEVVHYLKDYGLFSDDEWGTLVSAAQDEGWQDRYNIHERYAGLDANSKIEESIADAFREWAGKPENERATTGVGAIFQKIWDFLDRIRQGMGKYLGREPTWDDVFQRVNQGEVGAREIGKPEAVGQFRFSKEPPIVEYRRQAKDIEASLPPVQEGMTRLWRGNREGEVGKNPQFSDSLPGIALPFRKGYGGDLSYVDVSKNWFEAQETTPGATKGEVHLTPEMAAQAKVVPGREVKFSRDEQQKAIVEGITNLQAASVGMDTPTFQKLKDLIQKNADEGLRKTQARLEQEYTKRASKEWRVNESDMAKEVSAEIRNRPDVAADLFIGSGEFYGKKLQQRFTLSADSLTEEQKVALPDHYVSKNGLPPDAVAGMFGYSSGDEMVSRLGALEQLKLGAGDGKRLRTEELIRKVTQAETTRRMEARYGDTAAQALDDAKDQALSDSSINVKFEEYQAVAQSQGAVVFDKAVATQAAKNLLAEMPIGKVSSTRAFSDMGRDARNAEKAQIGGNWGEAAVHMQRQVMNMILAKEAKARETQIAKFEKDAKTWGKYKYGKAASMMASDYANVIQQALAQVGKKVQVPAAWLAREMQESGSGVDMKSFVDDKMKWGATIDPWETLYDPKTAFEFKKLTGDQFDRADSFLRSLVASGRAEKKVYKEGAAYDFDEKKSEMLRDINRLPSVGDSIAGKVARTSNSLMIQMETYIDKLDHWNPKGVWNDFLIRPLFETEHVEMDRTREVTKEIHEIVKLKFGNQDIPTIFKNPRNGNDIVATRKTLWAAMLNQGTEDNREGFAKSWGLKSDGVRAWIDAHATKEDWDGVQKLLDLFKKTGNWSDDEYRRNSDRAMKWIEPEPIQTQFGEYPGGYAPIMKNRDFLGKSANALGLSEKGLFGDGYSTGFVPGAGYRIERAGDISPMALDLDQVASRLMEQIHDGAMRGSVMQAAKILRDPELKDALIEKLGLEVYDGFIKHIRRIASGDSMSAGLSMSMRNVLGAGDFIRRNVISNMIGWNLGTVEKHGPTAFVTSLSQLGPGRMLDAYKEIWLGDEVSGARVRQMIYDKSALMRGRQRYWMDSVFGSVDKIHDDNTAIDKALRFREWSQWAATQPVAMSDALSAEPLWWGTYKKAKQAGEDEGQAVYMADKSVRKAHGAGGTVGQPLIVNEVSKWFTPMYNFYNSVLNKAVESYWRAGEARRNWTDGDYDKMKANMKAASVGGFVALVLPGVIHDIVSPPKTSPDDSWEFKVLKYIAGPIAAFVPGGANIEEYLTGSSTPDVGLQTAAMKQAFDFARDLTHKQTSVAAHEKMIKDGGSFMGFLGTVGGGRTIGQWASGLYGMHAGRERPQTAADVHNMVRFGTMRRKH